MVHSSVECKTQVKMVADGVSRVWSLPLGGDALITASCGGSGQEGLASCLQPFLKGLQS